MNGNFFVLNVGVYAEKMCYFSQISTANAPITNLFELQIQKSISKMVDFFVCEKIILERKDGVCNEDN